MRFFWYSCLVGSVVVAATILIGGDHSKPAAEAKEPAQSSEKKADEKKIAEKKTEPKVDNTDEEMLRRAKLPLDGKGLVEFLKKRTLPESERPEIERMLRSLRSGDYRIREKATLDLIHRGVAVLDMLRHPPTAANGGEATRRIELVMQAIQEKDVAPWVVAAVIRVASEHKSKDLVETLIGYLPFADNEYVLDELRAALTKHAVQAGKANPLLVAALSDRAAIRQATAAEVLARTAYAEQKDSLRELLTGADPFVRYRLARALVLAQQRDAIPVLIDTIPDLPLNAAWQAEDFLLKLATRSNAPTIAMGNSKEARDKCKAAWQEWWKQHGAKVDLAKLQDDPKLLGRTLVVLLDQNTVLDLGPDNTPRFEFKGIVFPLDAQFLEDGRVLVAEYHANRVAERNSRGEILWQKAGIQGPQVAQRLANGNTFVATAYQLLEYDKDDNTVLNVNLAIDGQQKIMKACKLDNGEIVCMLADGHIVRYDARGNELHSFPIQLGTRLFGGRIDVLPNGRVLVPHNAESKVIEYDSRGKIVWEVPFESPIAAMRLPNGNTLITSMNASVGAVEVDRAGTQVWSYTSPNSRVTRAIRR